MCVTSDMSLARSFGAVVSGVAGQIVVVEVDHSQGLPTVGVVGLPDASVNEARHRVRTALGNQDLQWPKGRVTISLSPAEVRKQGAGLDLAIAMGVLGVTGQIPASALATTVFVGELGLDGSIRQVPGALPATVAAAQAGFTCVVVPKENNLHCSVVPGITVLSYSSLTHVIAGLVHGVEALPPQTGSQSETEAESILDLSDVLGQHQARWALEIAAVGSHNMLMVGAPGVGKTLLAERLPGILPRLNDQQSLEVTSIHAIAGTLTRPGAITIPPFESPHHSSSLSAIVGGVHGQRVKPGSITKAHHGVLFLDEAPEFARNVVEVLRQPIESGQIVLNRAHWSGVLPARFQLLMAANPCPCGNASPETQQKCSCTSINRRNYAQRLSGPLLDRMDINISMPHVASTESGDSSTTVAQRVCEARERTHYRLHGLPWHVNAHVPASHLLGSFRPAVGGQELLDHYHRKSGGLRGAHRILRVAWSIADLVGHQVPDRNDIAMAIHLRERPEMLVA